MTYLFIALVCYPGWITSCDNQKEVRVERLTKEGCEIVKRDWEAKAYIKVASCVEQKK